jgi:hypothetical protein
MEKQDGWLMGNWEKQEKSFKPDREYNAMLYLPVGVVVFSVILGGIVNPQILLSTRETPHTIALVAFVPMSC